MGLESPITSSQLYDLSNGIFYTTQGFPFKFWVRALPIKMQMSLRSGYVLFCQSFT